MSKETKQVTADAVAFVKSCDNCANQPKDDWDTGYPCDVCMRKAQDHWQPIKEVEKSCEDCLYETESRFHGEHCSGCDGGIPNATEFVNWTPIKEQAPTETDKNRLEFEEQCKTCPNRFVIKYHTRCNTFNNCYHAWSACHELDKKHIANLEAENDKLKEIMNFDITYIKLKQQLKEAIEIIEGQSNCLRKFMKEVGGDFPLLIEKLSEVEQFLSTLNKE